MPRVLRIINRFNLGGPTYNAAYLTRYLPEEYETLLVGGIHDEGEESSDFIMDQLGLDYLKIPEMQRSIDFKRDRMAYRKIKSLIKEFQPDIVHTHASKAGALGRLAARSMGVKAIVHTFHGHVFHSYFGKLKTGVYKSLEKGLASRSTRIIAISEIQKKELSEDHRICPPEKIEVIPLGFDLKRFLSIPPDHQNSSFRAMWKIEPEEVVIAIIGRLAPIKNHELFIRSMGLLIEDGLRIRAMIIGDGSERNNIRALIERLGFTWSDKPDQKANFTFVGWVKDIEYALAGIDIVALSSLNEGTPVSLIEAQASGVPVVSTDVGGVRDITLPDRSGMIINDFSTESFARVFPSLIESSELRKKMGKVGRDFVAERFHYMRMVQDHHKLYQKLLQE
jgi:glycosyltransferase involved in cell wall biosynthesis